MSMIDKYNAALDAKQKELATYAADSIAKITLPVLPIVQQRETGGTTTNKSSASLIAGGAVVLIGGIALSKTVLAVLGGLALAGGIAMKVANAKNNTTDNKSVEPKYYQITNRVYTQLSDIQKHVFNEWKKTVEDNKDKLKNDINALSVNDEKKNAAIQSILSTSVIDIPMMTVSQELSAIERQKSIDTYRQYLQSFRTRCVTALDKAVTEQKRIYAKLNEVLG